VTDKIAAAGTLAKIGEASLSSAGPSASVTLSADISSFRRLYVVAFAKNNSGGGSISFGVYAGADASAQQIASGSAGASGELSPAVMDVFIAENGSAGFEAFTVFTGASSASAARWAGASAVSGTKVFFAGVNSARFASGSRFIVYAA